MTDSIDEFILKLDSIDILKLDSIDNGDGTVSLKFPIAADRFWEWRRRMNDVKKKWDVVGTCAYFVPDMIRVGREFRRRVRDLVDAVMKTTFNDEEVGE